MSTPVVIPLVDDEVRVLQDVVSGGQLVALAGSQGIVTELRNLGPVVRFPNGASVVTSYLNVELIGHNVGGQIMVEAPTRQSLEARVTYVHNPGSNIVHATARIGRGPRLSAEGCNLDDATDAAEYPSLGELKRQLPEPIAQAVELCAICVLPAIDG